MNALTEDQAIGLLKKYSDDKESFDRVLSHSRAVQKEALSIAKYAPKVDLDVIRVGSLLHDIGRFKYPPKTENSIRHGLEGGKIMRKEGFPLYARICERHLGIGISKEDIRRQHLNLPHRDFVPKTIEEEIIAYADNFIFGTKLVSLEKVLDRHRRELGEPYARRIQAQHEKIEKFKRNGFINDPCLT